MLRGRLMHDPADRRAASEKDEVPLLLQQRGRLRHGTFDHCDRAGIKIPGHQLCRRRRAIHGDFRRLDYGGVSPGQCRGQRPKGQHERLVPGANDERHAKGITADADVTGFEHHRHRGALWFHPGFEMLQGVISFLGAVGDVHQIGINEITM